MNQGQSDWLAFLQQLVANIGSAQTFSDQNLSALEAGHPCAPLLDDVQAVLDAIANSVPLQAALAQLQQDIVRLPAYAQIP